MRDLGIFGLELENSILIFQISTLEFVWLQNVVWKRKCLNYGPKISYLGFFLENFKKNYCHIWNKHPEICLIQKFCKKRTKMIKFGTKDASFGYLWVKILTKSCHIWSQHLQISLITKFRVKLKMHKLGTKNTLFGYFWARVSKN